MLPWRTKNKKVEAMDKAVQWIYGSCHEQIIYFNKSSWSLAIAQLFFSCLEIPEHHWSDWQIRRQHPILHAPVLLVIFIFLKGKGNWNVLFVEALKTVMLLVNLKS